MSIATGRQKLTPQDVLQMQFVNTSLVELYQSIRRVLPASERSDCLALDIVNAIVLVFGETAINIPSQSDYQKGMMSYGIYLLKTHGASGDKLAKRYGLSRQRVNQTEREVARKVESYLSLKERGKLRRVLFGDDMEAAMATLRDFQEGAIDRLPDLIGDDEDGSER